jgi:hypothetical protein
MRLVRANYERWYEWIMCATRTPVDRRANFRRTPGTFPSTIGPDSLSPRRYEDIVL